MTDDKLNMSLSANIIIAKQTNQVRRGGGGTLGEKSAVHWKYDIFTP